MIYYVDGYNLFFRGLVEYENANPLESQEISEFIEQVCKAKIEVVLVFDAYNSPTQISRNSYRGIEVVFTAKDQTADDYFLELIEFYKNKNDITFVSDDQVLCRGLRFSKGKTLSVSKFLKIVQKKGARLKRAHNETKHDIGSMDNEYYHRIFSQKKDKT